MSQRPQEITWKAWWEKMRGNTMSSGTISYPDRPTVALLLDRLPVPGVDEYACWNMPIIDWDAVQLFVKDKEPEVVCYGRTSYFGWYLCTFEPLETTEILLMQDVDLSGNLQWQTAACRERLGGNEGCELIDALRGLGLDSPQKNKDGKLGVIQFPFKRIFKGTFLSEDGFSMRWDTIPLFSIELLSPSIELREWESPTRITARRYTNGVVRMGSGEITTLKILQEEDVLYRYEPAYVPSREYYALCKAGKQALKRRRREIVTELREAGKPRGVAKRIGFAQWRAEKATYPAARQRLREEDEARQKAQSDWAIQRQHFIDKWLARGALFVHPDEEE